MTRRAGGIEGNKGRRYPRALTKLSSWGMGWNDFIGKNSLCFLEYGAVPSFELVAESGGRGRRKSLGVPVRRPRDRRERKRADRRRRERARIRHRRAG